MSAIQRFKPKLRFALFLTHLPGHWNLVVVDVHSNTIYRFEPLGYFRENQVNSAIRMAKGRFAYKTKLLTTAPQAVASGPFCASWMLMLAYLIALNASSPRVTLRDIAQYFDHKSQRPRGGKRNWDAKRRYLFQKVGMFTAYLWELATGRR